MNDNDITLNYKQCLESCSLSTIEDLTRKAIGGTDLLAHPLFHSYKDLSEYEGLLKTLFLIMNKILHLYYKNPTIQSFYRFNEVEKNMIMVHRPYCAPIPYGRIDIFNDINGNLKVCEINASGTSGMKKSKMIDQIIKQIEPVKKLMENNKISLMHNFFDNLVDTANSVYNKYCDHKKSFETLENVAILNFKKGNDHDESNMIRKKFEDRGFNAYYLDPSEISIDNGELYFKNQKIQLIYSEINNDTLLKNLNNSPEVFSLYASNKSCLWGGYHSKLFDDKQFMAIIHMPEVRKELNEYELDFVQKFIPQSWFFDAENFNYDTALVDKNEYVLKSFDTFKGIGVYIGKDYTSAEWEKIASSCWNQSYIIQQYIETERKEFLALDNCSLVNKQMKYVVGLFCMEDSFSGIYTRASTDNMVQSSYANTVYLANILAKY